MPENEVGDRVHNFFDQGSLLQDQRHTQFVASSRTGYNNNIWNANERQVGTHVNTGPENYSSQQSDIERGQGNQFPLRPNGLNFARQNLRPECVKNPSQLPQPNLNGFMHASQVGHTRHNVANFLGVDTEPDHHNAASKSPGLDSQQKSGSQFMNFANYGGLESPMIFNFFGGQHQMNGQQPGIMQSLPQQQHGYNDAQLQQQFILKQLEQQRQHQLQQIEALQRSSTFFPNQTGGQHPLSMNGNLSRDGSNMNMQQRGLSASVPGHSNGFMITPEQGQAMQYVGFIPQQTSQSLYGVPVSSSQSPNAYLLSNLDKPGMLQFSASSSSFSANQHGAFVEQASVKEGNMVSRYGFEGNISSEQASTQPSGNNLGGFTQVQQRNVRMSEGGVQGFAGGSEFAMEKSVSQGFSQGASTQAAAGLDPTEEKILFGNDENIWEAFGGASLTGNEDATDLLNGFPSMQNGTWSALMQSAVAETSNADGGTQEEWSGLGSKNSRQQSGSQHPSVSHVNEKSLHNLVERSPRASLGSHHSSNDMNMHNAMTKINFGNSSGQQHFLNRRRDINDVQQSSQPNSLKFMGFVPENGALVSNQDYLLEKGRGMQLRIDASDGAVTKFEPVPNSNIKLGSSHVSLKDGTLSPVSSNIKVNLESSQMLPNNRHLDLWKSVDALGKSRFEDSGGDQHNLSKEPPTLESSDNCPDGGSVGRHETENGDRRESSSDGHHTSFTPNASVGSSRGNMWSDSADRCSFPGREEMPSGQAVKKGPITRNQYPMGNIDVSRDSYASKQVLYSQSMSQHFPVGVKGQEVNPRFLGAMSTNMTDMEGRVSDYQRPVHVSCVVSSGATPGYMPNISAASVQSGEISTLNQHLSSSQNVLELLHKVDQSKEQNDTAHYCTPDYGRLFDKTAGGVAGPSQSHSSTSHGFNLQLAPPSQGIAPPTFSNAVQSSSRTMGSSSTGSGKGDKHAWLVSVSSAQCLPPSDQPTQMDIGTEPSRLGNMDGDAELKFKDNLSISSYRSPPQTEHSTAPGGRTTGNQSSNMAVDRQGFHDQKLNDSQPQAISSHPVNNSHGNLVVGREMNTPSVQGQMRKMPGSFPAVMSGMSRKDNLSHLWASHQLLGAQACNSPDLLKSQFQLSNVPETSFTKQKEIEQDVPERVGASGSHRTVDGVETQITDAQSSVKEASPSSHTITQKDIEPFHSLENQYNKSDNNSMMHQMQTMKNLGYDPSHRESKRLKSEDYVHDLKKSAGQRVIPFTSSMDSMAGDLSPQLGNQNTFQFQHGAVTSQDMFSFNDPKNFATGNVTCRTEHTGINPQMAPSWFGQYGTLRNGQLLPVHNVSRMPMKHVEHQLISGNPPNNLIVNNSVPPYAAASEAGPVANTCQIATGCPSDHVSSLHALVPHVSAPSPASMIPKKPKTATSDLLSWNKEIGQCLKRLHNLSSAEVDWAHSSNRLIEKVEDDIDNNDLLPLTRSRRRLLLTTHLMQQVLRPPSVGVLSLDASLDHEVIVYSLVRSVLGDACSLICSVKGSSPVESAKLLSGKVETVEKIQDQDFSKVVKDFLSREKELENELLRLDKRASLMDFRLDCQDLERFSVINRFAQFHGRGQVDGAETSSSSDANATVLKPCPQRYVTAHPMPRNVPEKVQCLSL